MDGTDNRSETLRSDKVLIISKINILRRSKLCALRSGRTHLSLLIHSTVYIYRGWRRSKERQTDQASHYLCSKCWRRYKPAVQTRAIFATVYTYNWWYFPKVPLVAVPNYQYRQCSIMPNPCIDRFFLFCAFIKFKSVNNLSFTIKLQSTEFYNFYLYLILLAIQRYKNRGNSVTGFTLRMQPFILQILLIPFLC